LRLAGQGARSPAVYKPREDRRDQWALTVNACWRICFTFRNGDAFDVEIVDYHRG